jgi:nitric oxide reductase large subunit
MITITISLATLGWIFGYLMIGVLILIALAFSADSSFIFGQQKWGIKLMITIFWPLLVIIGILAIIADFFRFLFIRKV